MKPNQLLDRTGNNRQTLESQFLPEESMPYLTVQPSTGKRYQVPFDKDVIRVGRSSRNDIHLSFDPSLSRFHAEFVREGDQYLIRDVGSRNGTSLNGELLSQAMDLRPGDRVSLGETVIFFTVEPESEVVIDEAGTPSNTVVMPLGEIITSPIATFRRTRSRPSGERTSPQGRAFGVLTRAANEMLSHRPLDETLEVVMDMVFEALSPDRGTVMLLEGEPPRLKAKVVREGRGGASDQIQLSRAITEAVVGGQQSVMTSDTQADERFSSRESIQIQGIKSALCVPLWNNKEVIGLVYVDSLGAPGKFDKDDLRLLTLLANLAAVKIENVRLFMEEQRNKQMQRELETAAQIQRRLLPAAAPPFDGYEITGHSLPCREVGGDYYDFLPLGATELAVAIGDVSGKGMGAALLMATLQASFRAHVTLDLPLPELVSRLNHAVVANSMANNFITFFLGRIDGPSGRLVYTNAGHNPPILLRADGSVERLRTGGMILGILADAAFASEEVTLANGDVLVTFSDGITESQNEAEEEYGDERLIEVVRENRAETAERIREAIHESVETFMGTAPQFDDVTLTVLKRA
ncbi:MAG: SpoIIE family protein phosphatase [Acidobacteriota bacterium]|jgi:serine phosphatase RsbU (regulator of sigma subunit)/pSer/pThr/pTyr-binding forkhead associated (FHA) protein